MELIRHMMNLNGFRWIVFELIVSNCFIALIVSRRCFRNAIFNSNEDAADAYERTALHGHLDLRWQRLSIHLGAVGRSQVTNKKMAVVIEKLAVLSTDANVLDSKLYMLTAADEKRHGDLMATLL